MKRQIMSQWAVPFVFGIGLIVLITALSLRSVLWEHRATVEKIEFGSSQESSKVDDSEYLREAYERQLEYERIQQEFPNLSEEELLQLPQVQALIAGSEPMQGYEEDAWVSLKLGELTLPDEAYPEIGYSSLQDALGFLKYGTNVDENYTKLTEYLPAYLSRNLRIEDFWESDYVRLTSYPLSSEMYITCLTRLDKVEMRIYVTQGNSNGNSVLNVCTMNNVRFADIVVTSSSVIVNTTDAALTKNALFLFGEKDDSFKVLSSLVYDGLLSIYQTGELITAMGKDTLFDITVEDNQLILRAKNGEEFFGVVYD